MKGTKLVAKAIRNDPMYEGIKKVIAKNTPISGSVLDTARQMVKPISDKKLEQAKADQRLSYLTAK
jgi:hypothetical protein